MLEIFIFELAQKLSLKNRNEQILFNREFFALMDKISRPINIKTIFIGDSGAGKTSLINRQMYGKSQNDICCTLAFAYLAKKYNLEQKTVQLQFWDTAGQQRFRSLAPLFYRVANVVVLCFDLSNRQSFENLTKWIDQLNRHDDEQSRQIFLIGCKSDLVMNITADQIINFAEKHKLIYFQTSAKTGDGVKDAFNHIARLSLQQTDKMKAYRQEQILLKKKKTQDQNQNSCYC